MQEHIRLLIERAQRSEDRITVNGRQDSATILAEEVIRLAHLATSSHLLLWAQNKASDNAISAETTVEDASQLHLSQQEQTS